MITAAGKKAAAAGMLHVTLTRIYLSKDVAPNMRVNQPSSRSSATHTLGVNPPVLYRRHDRARGTHVDHQTARFSTHIRSQNSVFREEEGRHGVLLKHSLAHSVMRQCGVDNV